MKNLLKTLLKKDYSVETDTGRYLDFGKDRDGSFSKLELHQATGGCIPINGRIKSVEEFEEYIEDKSLTEKYPGWFIYTADCAGPKRHNMSRATFMVIAENRETLQNLIGEHVIPLYESALKSLRETGEDRFKKC